MDPHATMAEILGLLIREPEDSDEQGEIRDQLIEHLDALQNWLAHGGFLPDAQNPRLLLAVGNLFHEFASREPAAAFQGIGGTR